MSLTLVIGNKNYSSWSLRPWIAMTAAGIVFTEVFIPLDQPDTKERIKRHSPAGKVPVLIDGDITVWESLSVLEHLAERFPKAGLWPEDPAARAEARSVAAEMHSSFAALRSHCPMNLWRPVERRELTPQVEQDVARITQIWRMAREQHGKGSSFLFGGFTAADAMFAPIATRFRTYDIPCDAVSRAYIEAIHELPAFRAWRDAAYKESFVIAQDEVDWPQVKKVPEA
ncbi:glutathione S-transferase [Rhizobiales bacterium GAS191]|jgi:glutathione S-transferase|nr:glutathione S-transferase [Rhizobiales bacterium GAS113]SEE14934.1 glutathione S-transferase [Rhizobiales bacterium GAS191]SEE40241.1 glutathione S-transferase [Rhizobiales bacterium GAS188]